MNVQLSECEFRLVFERTPLMRDSSERSSCQGRVGSNLFIILSHHQELVRLSI